MKKHTIQSGFTLVELMVSIAIFTIVVVAVIGSVYTANASARKVQATETVLNNVHFALESMVRTIRTGVIVSCDDTQLPPDGIDDVCIDGSYNTGFITVHSLLGGKDVYIKYYFDGNQNENSIKKEVLEVVNGIPANTWGEPVAITAPSVFVNKFYITTTGLASTDKMQRGAAIAISGYANTNTDHVPFSIQTFVSQRNF